jgi:hypothetical protein
MPGDVGAALLAAADPLPYPRRMALFAARARAAAASGELPQLLAQLLGGDAYSREVGLFIAVVAGDLEHIEAMTQAPEWRLRYLALAAWLRSRQVPSDAVAQVLHDAPIQLRWQVYRLVRARGHSTLADELVDQVRARFGDREAARLLPGCSTETVARLLPELGHAVGNWATLARRHPEAALDDAARQLAGLTAPARLVWWSRRGPGTIAVGALAPERVLDLVERFAPPTFLPGRLRSYGVLAAAQPQRVLALLADPARAAWLTRIKLPQALLDRFGRLAPEALEGLARRLRVQEVRLAALLAAVPPRHRGRLYEASMVDFDRSQALLTGVMLQVLPRRHRAVEAARILQLGQTRDDDNLRLWYTSFLPWDEARATLIMAMRRADADDRAIGYELLLACAGRSGDPAAVSEALGLLGRLRNEQDPVRSRVLAAVSQVPPGLLQPDVAPVLAQLVTDAVQARDSSGQTLDALSALAVTVLRHHIDSPPLLQWSLRTLERLSDNERIPMMGRLDTLLRHGQEREAFAAVRPWIEAGIRRGKFQPLFTIAHALHKRAWNLPDLQDMLGQGIRKGRTSAVVRQATYLWLADPATRGARVEQVLLEDSSTVTLSEVWHAMCIRRTDLLDLVLTGTPPAGRFLTAGVRWVPTYAPGVRRWLPRQQKSYVDLLARVVADPGTVTHTRAAALASGAKVPGHGWALVHRYLDSANVNLAEAALGALPWTDRPEQALPILLAHADDDRARVATYAAGRAARFVPPGQLLPTLAEYALARGKVTSRKEAMRLLAHLAVPGAVTVLQQAWRQEGQHRDVRAAVVSAARLRLEDDDAWAILRDAATGGREDIQAVLAADAFEVAERHRRAYAQMVVEACRSHDPQVAREAWQKFPGWAQWLPDPAAGVIARLTDLDDRIVWRAVAPAVVALVDAGLGDPILADALVELARLDAADPTSGDQERDRPARRRLDGLVHEVVAWAAHTAPTRDRQTLRAAGRGLAEHLDFTPQAAVLLLHGAEIAYADLTEICGMLADRPAAAAQLATQLTNRLLVDQTTQVTHLLAVAEQLRDRGDLAGGLFATSVAACGQRYGWSTEWRVLAAQLRRHPVADVRDAALNLTMVDE